MRALIYTLSFQLQLLAESCCYSKLINTFRSENSTARISKAGKCVLKTLFFPFLLFSQARQE